MAKKKRKKRVVNKPKKSTKKRVRRVKRKAKKAVRKTITFPVAVVKKTKRKAGFPMAKRRGKKRGSRRGGPEKRVSIKHLALDGAAVVGGVLGGAVLSNVIPVADGRIKAAASIGLGVLLAGSNIIKGSVGKMAALGMVAGGTLSLIRRSVPTLTALAGEDESIEGLEYDISGPAMLDYSGEDEVMEIAADDTESEAVEGEIEELTGSAELLGAEQWAVAE